MTISLKEFEEWALQNMQVANPQKDTYIGECVSLIQQYLWQCFGIPYAARGNAKDWVNVKLDNFEHLGVIPTASLKPGDIIVYDERVGDKNGHIEMIDVNGKRLAQNRNGSRKVELFKNKPSAPAVDVIRPQVGLRVLPDEKLPEQPVEEPAQRPDGKIAVGCNVIPVNLVSYDGAHLRQFDPTYVVTEIKGDRAVLSARGVVWAALKIDNVRLA